MKRERCTGAVVKTITPYDTEGKIDLQAFRRYIGYVKAEGAETILVPSEIGDLDLLSFEERQALVRAAAEEAGDQALIAAQVTACEISPEDQTKAYLALGADAVCLRMRFTSAEEYEAAADAVIGAGAQHVILTDYGPGGFDMNTGTKRAAGIPADEILKLFETRKEVKGVIIAVPLNETGSKCSLLAEKTGHQLNIIADTATDQIPEQIDRGAEGFTTGLFVRVFIRICELFKKDREEGRKLFFSFLRVIVWTKQYVDREPYLYQLYLKNAGIIPVISYRTERYIDEYMERDGAEMEELARETEKRCA